MTGLTQFAGKTHVKVPLDLIQRTLDSLKERSFALYNYHGCPDTVELTVGDAYREANPDTGRVFVVTTVHPSSHKNTPSWYTVICFEDILDVETHYPKQRFHALYHGLNVLKRAVDSDHSQG